jgi:hypothetical protein
VIPGHEKLTFIRRKSSAKCVTDVDVEYVFPVETVVPSRRTLFTWPYIYAFVVACLHHQRWYPGVYPSDSWCDDLSYPESIRLSRWLTPFWTAAPSVSLSVVETDCVNRHLTYPHERIGTAAASKSGLPSSEETSKNCRCHKENSLHFAPPKCAELIVVL